MANQSRCSAAWGRRRRLQQQHAAALLFLLCAIFCGQPRLIAAYPALFVQGGYANGCTSHPTAALGAHKAPLPDRCDRCGRLSTVPLPRVGETEAAQGSCPAPGGFAAWHTVAHQLLLLLLLPAVHHACSSYTVGWMCSISSRSGKPLAGTAQHKGTEPRRQLQPEIVNDSPTTRQHSCSPSRRLSSCSHAGPPCAPHDGCPCLPAAPRRLC